MVTDTAGSANPSDPPALAAPPTRLVERVAQHLLDDYSTEYQADHLTWRDFERSARALIGVMYDWIDEQRRALPQGRDESFRSGFNAAVRAVRDES